VTLSAVEPGSLTSFEPFWTSGIATCLPPTVSALSASSCWKRNWNVRFSRAPPSLLTWIS
jgi:hypothetical protein